MSKFKGKNQIRSSKNAFWGRLKYKTQMGENIDPKAMEAVVDFNFSDLTGYGKFDFNYETVIPKYQLLKNYVYNSNQDTPIPMVEFVADQLNDLLRNLNNRVLLGEVSRQCFFNEIKPAQGFIDPITEYENYMKIHFENFNESYLRKNIKKITTFDNYLQVFYDYVMKLGIDFPVTLTGWYKSKKANPFCTGLYVDLLKISKENDSEKEKLVLDSAFPYYLNACKQFGFHVSKNNPNIIVSNIQSPATIKYLNNYKIYLSDKVFNLYYMKTSNFDLDLLMRYLYDGYTDFLSQNPDKREFHFGKNGHMISKLHKRKSINNINIYNNKYIIYYINIRNIEENNYLNEADLIEFEETIIYLSKKIDKERLMSYINVQYNKNTASKVGSLSWFEQYLEDK